MSQFNKLFISICCIIFFVLVHVQVLLAQQQKSNTGFILKITTDSLEHAQSLDSLLKWQANDTLPDERFIGFHEFITAVAAHNLDYAVQKYNISIARAQITIAKLYPDPSLSAGFTKDITNVPSSQKFGDVWSAGATETILLGNKIGARSDVAQQNQSIAEAQTEDFFRNLRATSATAYVAALIADSNYKADVRTYENLAELAHINERRVSAGDLGKIDLIQSRVDAIQARGAVLQADAARRQAFITLGQLMGCLNSDTLYRPVGNLSLPAGIFNLDTLIERAESIRPDVIAARHAVESARLNINLAHAERWPDLTVGAGYAYTGTSTNNVAPFPGEKSLNFGISIPIPLSDVINKGTLQEAEYTYEQAQNSLESAKLKAETDVRTAYMQFQLAKQQFIQYSSDLLSDAMNVRQARLYSFKAGSATLLDVLTAENTLASVYLAYYSALSGYANSLVVLEQSAGMWDIDFR
jgi:outer membrane protein TolC